MIKPVRLQLSRRKGFKLQALSRSINGLPARKVTRPGPYGNIFIVGLVACSCRAAGECSHNSFRREAAKECVDDFAAIPRSDKALARIKDDLAGHNLACACRLCDRHKAGKPLGDICADCAPCHADVLLELANR
jgi:hypothetical protein